MSNDQFTVLIYVIVATGAALIAGGAGLAYVKTSGKAGGVICILFLWFTIVTASHAIDLVNKLN